MGGKVILPICSKTMVILMMNSIEILRVRQTRLTKVLEENKLIAQEQNGFRKKCTITWTIFIHWCLSLRTENVNNTTFICFVDMQKSFDTVNRHCLWVKLFKMGLSGKMYFAIKTLYEGVTCSMRLNGTHTEWFDVNNGVEQGCCTVPNPFQYFHM